MRTRKPIIDEKAKATVISSVCSTCSKPRSSNIFQKLRGNDSCRCSDDEHAHDDVTETAEKDRTSIELPTLPDKFNVIECVGKGGMANVFKVIDTQSKTVFAVKVLPDELANDREATKRFEQEAQALSKLDHPNIVSVHDYGTTTSGAPYLVMDFVEGHTLADQIKREGALHNVDRAIDIFTELCEALSYAHKSSILHRDLKPANVLMKSSDTKGSVIRITDFGIAKVLPSGSSEVRETHDLTKTGELFGTPLYMSPEQCLGFKLDERSDIYSLGCLMYEVMTGHAPFDAANAVQVVVKHLNETPKPISSSPGKQLSSLEKVIFKCLAKNKEERYDSVELLLRDLEKIKTGQDISINTAVHEETPSHSRGEILLACGELVLCGLTGFVLSFGGVVTLLPLLMFYAWLTHLSWVVSRKRKRSDWFSTLNGTRIGFIGSSSLLLICINYGILEGFPQQFSYLIPILYFFSLVSLGVLASAVAGNLIFGKRLDQTPRKIAVRISIMAIPLMPWAYSAMPTSLAMVASMSSVGRTSDASTSLEKTPKTLIAVMRAAQTLNLRSIRYEELVDLLNETGQHNQAVSILTDALTKVETKRELLRLRALTYAEMGQVDTAIKDVRLAQSLKASNSTYIDPFSSNFDASDNKLIAAEGDILLLNKHYADAIKTYNDCLIDPRQSSSSALEHRAIAKQIVGDKRGALADLNQLVMHFRSPSKVNYFLMRARWYELNNVPDSALADYKRAADVLKQDEKSYPPDEDIAQSIARIIIHPLPISGSYLERAYVYHKLGETEKSNKYLRLAEVSGRSKEDLLREYNKMLGKPLDW